MPKITSAPHLFATAHGLECVGSLRCFYCGAPCDNTNTVADYVRDSFTGHSEVVAPGSRAICNGCVLCLREAGDIPMIDGTVRPMTKCAVRSWSWLVTPRETLAGSKAHLDRWRELCLNPPETPFAIVLSESGQKHLLYRGVVCHSRESLTVTLETERVSYRPDALRERLKLCGRIAAATGKPALAEAPPVSLWMRVCDRYEAGESLCSEWSSVWEEPLSRLAAFLTPAKEVCIGQYPGDRHAGIPAAGGGPDRPAAQDRRSRGGER